MRFDKFAINFGITLFLAAVLIGSVAMPLIDQSFVDIKDLATKQNYTATASKVDGVKNNVNMGIWLLLLNFILAPIIELVTRKSVSTNFVKAVFGFSLGLMFLAILGFKLAIPKVIESGLLADGDLALMLDLIGVIILLAGLTGLLKTVYRAVVGRREAEEVTVRLS